MIRAGIIGGSNPMAGELVRLLINHPDVEIMWVDSARYTGRLVSDVHHGLLGETELRIAPFTSSLLDDINVLFIFRHKGQTLEWLEDHEVPEKLCIVDLSVDMRDPENAEKHQFVYGLPELNRKALVRGALRTVLPHPVAQIIELSVLPMSKLQDIGSAVTAVVSQPAASEPVESAAALADEVSRAIKVLHPAFDQPVGIEVKESADERAMTASVTFDTTMDIGEIMRAYEEFYDDHNFTFIVNQELEAKEVVGTNKCLMRLDKSENTLKVTAIMDAILKGAAGTAVHDMNLLFGLHERIGLALKASTY